MPAPRFTFRPLAIDDLEMLHGWLARPHVAAWWGDPPSLAQVEEDYGADIASSEVRPFVACLEGTSVGFIQVYTVMGADPAWWADETDPGARGIDQYLAEEALLGRGLGSAMIAEFVAKLFEDDAVTKVQTDPSPDNARAIRAYEKVGFRRVGLVETPDGTELLMVVRREDLVGRASG